MRTAFPLVTVKLGASLDGRTAMASGEPVDHLSRGAPGRAAAAGPSRCGPLQRRNRAGGWRLPHRALGRAAPSVKAVYPKETLRQPLRVIVDSQNRLTPDLPLFQSESPVLLARHKASGEWPAWVQQLEVPLLDGKLDLVSLFMLLAKQNVNSVLVEAGPRLVRRPAGEGAGGRAWCSIRRPN